MSSIVDLLRMEIVQRARDPKGARLLIRGLLAELEEELLNTDWQPFFEDLEREPQDLSSYVETYEMKHRLAAIEAQLTRTKTQHAQKVSKKVSRKLIPRDLPPGTMYARDFYEKHGVSYSHFRRHTEHGFNGDLLEVTEKIPYPQTRPNYKDRYLTPSQQAKAIEYWDKYGTPYIVSESDQG